MDIFNLALRKFKKLHFRQEQERKFPVCRPNQSENDESKV